MKKKYIFIILFLMLLVFPLELKALIPEFYFLGQSHTLDASGDHWNYTVNNHTLVLDGFHYNGTAKHIEANGWDTIIYSTLDDLRVEVYGENQIDLNGIEDEYIEYSDKWACYDRDIYFMVNDTANHYENGAFVSYDAHTTFVGTGTLTINITGGKDMIAFLGNSVTIDGPTIIINVDGLEDNDNTNSVNEASDHLQAMQLAELNVESGNLTTNCYARDTKTELDGIEITELNISGGKTFVNLDSLVPANIAQACTGNTATITDGTLICDSTETTNGENIWGTNYGMYFSDTINISKGKLTATAKDVVNPGEYTSDSIGLFAPNLNISGGTVTATAGKATNYSLGIRGTTINFTGGTTYAKGDEAIVFENNNQFTAGVSAYTKINISGSAVVEAESSNRAFYSMPNVSKDYVKVVHAGDEKPGELVENVINTTYYNHFVRIENQALAPEPDEPDEPIEQTYAITYDYNGGTKNGKTTETINTVFIVATLSAENLLEGVTPPAGKELEAIEIDGVRQNLGFEFEINHDATIKYIWKDVIVEIVVPVVIPEVSISTTNNTITLTWENQTSATKYEIQRSTDNKKWSKLANVTEVNYVDKKLTYGKNYYYKVKAYDGTKWTKYSNVVNKKVVPNKVNLSVKSVGTNNVKLSWDKVSVTGYEVYRSTDNKKWSKVTTITKSSTLEYNNKKLKANKTYYYKVRAYKTVSGKKVYGKYSDVLKVKTAPEKPKFSLSIKEYNEMNLKIGSVKGASIYRVEKSLDGKVWESVEELPSAGTLAQAGLEIGKTYYFRVRACNASGYCSKWVSASKKQTTKVPGLTLETSSKKVTVSVTAVNEAEGYEVYRATSKKGKYTKVKTLLSTDELTFDNKTKKGVTYYYKVRSYKTVVGKKVNSDYTKVKSIKSK